jgi:hypothetical protein
MAGLDPAIHVFDFKYIQDVDARDKRGHDESNLEAIYEARAPGRRDR